MANAAYVPQCIDDWSSLFISKKTICRTIFCQIVLNPDAGELCAARDDSVSVGGSDTSNESPLSCATRYFVFASKVNSLSPALFTSAVCLLSALY